MTIKTDLELEIEAFEYAEKAYWKACETSDSQNWMKAACFAQQHRNTLRRLYINKYKDYRSNEHQN